MQMRLERKSKQWNVLEPPQTGQQDRRQPEQWAEEAARTCRRPSDQDRRLRGVDRLLQPVRGREEHRRGVLRRLGADSPLREALRWSICRRSRRRRAEVGLSLLARTRSLSSNWHRILAEERLLLLISRQLRLLRPRRLRRCRHSSSSSSILLDCLRVSLCRLCRARVVLLMD